MKLKVLFFTLFLATFLFSVENEKSKILMMDLNITKELKDKYHIKGHHSKVKLTCLDCHYNQGSEPSKFKAIGDDGCLSCHESKKKLANRLSFMDLLKANPHNSIHDGPTLYCDECHFEHKKSTNMCLECHENEVAEWMGVTP